MMRKYYFIAFLFSEILLDCCKLHQDFARVDLKNDWSHHYAFGSPSWDSFERFPNNPVYQGRDGMEWPVNGFLFSDPVSKNWYLYIGEYRRNYRIEKDSTARNFNCAIYKSTDRGKSWGKTGDLFPLNMPCYDSLRIQSPDVMVVYHEGKYHLIFDWVSVNSSWTQMGQTGIGYAISDHPEGPYQVSSKPLKINTQYKDAPLMNRYWRMYAPMLVRRQNDWVMLYMMDTAPPRSWALAASTARQPEGPYSDPILIKNVERNENYPPLMEYFPAFSHDGYSYFPATSVALNRNYQLINRVKTEEVTDPDKWETYRAGSFWHSTPAANEYAGIWGQTVTGFVDDSDSLIVMYPSKNKLNYGTINLAKASWSHFFHQNRFAFSACEGGSFTWIKKGINLQDLKMDFDLTGTMRLIWDFQQPLEIRDTWGAHSFNQNKGDFKELVLTKDYWKIRYINSLGVQVTDSGKLLKNNQSGNHLELKRENNEYTFSLNHDKYWKGVLPIQAGVIGLILDPHSTLTVDRFEVKGKQIRGKLYYGYYEALLNAGNQEQEWEFKKDSLFRYRRGAISKQNSAFAKWNFEGTGFELWLPEGPQFGTVSISIDGQPAGIVQLKNDHTLNSRIVFTSKPLRNGAHSLFLETRDGQLPVDGIGVIF